MAKTEKCMFVSEDQRVSVCCKGRVARSLLMRKVGMFDGTTITRLSPGGIPHRPKMFPCCTFRMGSWRKLIDSPTRKFSGSVTRPELTRTYLRSGGIVLLLRSPHCLKKVGGQCLTVYQNTTEVQPGWTSGRRDGLAWFVCSAGEIRFHGHRS